MPAMQQGPESRRALRRKVLKGAKISFHNMMTSTDCTVRNLSDTGACLIVTSQVGVPDDFDLMLECDRSVKRCHVEWRAGTKIGVSFR